MTAAEIASHRLGPLQRKRLIGHRRSAGIGMASSSLLVVLNALRVAQLAPAPGQG